MAPDKEQVQERLERYAQALYETLEVSPARHPWASLSPLRRAVWYDRATAAMAQADTEYRSFDQWAKSVEAENVRLRAALGMDLDSEPVEPDNPAAHALARHIADHPTGTVQAAFRHLGIRMSFEVVPEPESLRAAIASCPGHEMAPNPCRCPCHGCKHHCAAHDPEPESPREDFYCGADLDRDEFPFTCHRHVAHDGPCGPDRDKD